MEREVTKCNEEKGRRGEGGKWREIKIHNGGIKMRSYLVSFQMRKRKKTILKCFDSLLFPLFNFHYCYYLNRNIQKIEICLAKYTQTQFIYLLKSTPKLKKVQNKQLK